MNRRSLLAAGAAFIGLISSWKPSFAFLDKVGFDSGTAGKMVIGTAHQPFQIQDLFTKIAAEPGASHLEFPLDFINVGNDDECNISSTCVGDENGLASIMGGNYITLLPYEVVDKEWDALGLLIMSGLNNWGGIITLDKDNFYNEIIERHKDKRVKSNKTTKGLCLVIVDTRINELAAFDMKEKHWATYDFNGKIVAWLRKLMPWNPKEEGLVVCVSDTYDSFVNSVHSDIKKEGMGILDSKCITIGKIKL